MNTLKAAIDLGSNTLLLLVARTDGNSVEPIKEMQRIPRLGKGVDEQGNLDTNAMERALDGLHEYKNALKQYGDIPVVVTATSATRDAANGKAFTERIEKETGFAVKVLSGDEEASVTYKGALSMLNIRDTRYGVIDIGGGSTEIAMGISSQLESYYSYNMGCVRFTERYLKQHPAKQADLEACRNAVALLLKGHPVDLKQTGQLIGVAGTVTSLAYLIQEQKSYDAAALNGTEISLQQIMEWQQILNSLSIAEMEQKWPLVMEGRADIFMAGLLILEGILKKSGKQALTVSTGGIRHGMLLL